jgi:hypothetical protein
MQTPIRNSVSMQEASSQTYQGEYLPPRHVWTYGRKDAFSFCVGRIGSKNLHIVRLTESGATPPAELALLLLALPLLLLLQKLAAEPE